MRPDFVSKLVYDENGVPLDYASIIALSTNPSEMSGLTHSGISISERITEAFVRAVPITGDDGPGYRLVPFARIRRSGLTREFDAGDIDGFPADYVIADGRIIPFAKDFISKLRELIGDLASTSLKLSAVISILNRTASDPDLEIVISPLPDGAESAGKLTADVTVPGLNAKLYPYQAQGVNWLSEFLDYSGGGILADEMGLGKTLQIIATLLLRRPSPNNPALVICPTSLIENWCREIGKFAPGLGVHVHRGAERAGIPSGLTVADIVITTYDTLVNDQLVFQRVRWSYVIADEAQALKNPDSRRRNAAISLTRERTLAVTGTPVENSLLDLWSLADFAIPGILGSRNNFEKQFPDTQASASTLADITGPFILKRTVADVAKDLPERITADIPLALPENLALRYESIRAEILEKYPKAGALVATGQLQLFCAHPSLRGELGGDEDCDHAIAADPAESNLMTPKLERALALLEEAFYTGKKVLVFSAFNAVGQILQDAARGLPEAMWGAINGATPQEQRQEIVDRFTDHDGPAVLILNPRAAGAGLNITAATVVIHFVPVWNPAIEAQASARAHRRGQTQPVTIYRLFYTGTVEEVMLARISWKNDLANDAVIITAERNRDDLARALSMSPTTAPNPCFNTVS